MKSLYKIKSGVKLNRLHPDTFEIPSDEDKALVKRGDFVKLIFESDYGTERMWVEVVNDYPGGMNGKLANYPFNIPGLEHGDPVDFKPKHIIDIMLQEEAKVVAP